VKDLTNFSTLVWKPEGKKHLWIQILISTADSQWQKTIFVKIQKLKSLFKDNFSLLFQ
jgi:hypothetical protein